MNCLSKSVYIFCMTIILLPVTLTRQDTFSFFFSKHEPASCIYQHSVMPRPSFNSITSQAFPSSSVSNCPLLCQQWGCHLNWCWLGRRKRNEPLWNPRILNERSLTLDHKTLAAPQVATLIKLSRIITARTGEKDTQSLSPMKATVSPPAKSP